MQKKHLKRKLDLYLEGNASPDTTKQVEEWLSDTGGRTPSFPEPLLQEEERRILADIRSETEYPLFYPSREEKDLKQAILVGAFVCCLFVVLLMLLHH
ncbi:hypothetical protein [Dinghuibacter silviterrae]|uniref:Uncharacterized protein n=1 Tax=Dinghuibacter silviterrae TaxID=1539049 RepID=A0A4R8DSB8_9BACT|nr:hypothetical protein [Dinghuibacter silviterrae]TDX00738.1 hypothetical protein EDB95_1766 [Dinghuibacter silviterrae]